MMELAGDDFSGLEYTIETEQGGCRIRAGASIQDMALGRFKSGAPSGALPFPEETYDWEMDQPLKHPYDETILYRLMCVDLPVILLPAPGSGERSVR